MEHLVEAALAQAEQGSEVVVTALLGLLELVAEAEVLVATMEALLQRISAVLVAAV
jgi:hypothetical protein